VKKIKAAALAKLDRDVGQRSHDGNRALSSSPHQRSIRARCPIAWPVRNRRAQFFPNTRPKVGLKRSFDRSINRLRRYRRRRGRTKVPLAVGQPILLRRLDWGSSNRRHVCRQLSDCLLRAVIDNEHFDRCANLPEYWIPPRSVHADDVRTSMGKSTNILARPSRSIFSSVVKKKPNLDRGGGSDRRLMDRASTSFSEITGVSIQ
jgi:hypothetical protein